MRPEVAARCKAAVALAHQGYAIGQCFGFTPDGRCVCGDAGCQAPGKHGGKGWKDQATQDPDVIGTRFASGDPNYMVIPQAGSRLLVVDEDHPGALEELGPLPDTFIVFTSVKSGGIRGRHVYGSLPDGIDEKDIPYKWTGGEVRVAGNGGVVGPGSRHASGVSYEPANESPVATLPGSWLRALISSGREFKQTQDATGDPDDADWFVSEGERHSWLMSMAGRLRRATLGGDILRDNLRHLNEQRCRPPLPQKEVDEIASFASRKDAGLEMDATIRPQPIDVGTAEPPPDVDDWVIDGVLRPKGILVIASAEGVGKSFIRKEMGVRLAACGGRLFGHYPIPGRCRILEIDEENGWNEEYRREEQVFASLGIDRSEVTGNYHRVSFTALDLGKDDSKAYIEDQLELFQPDVLMLDTGTSMVDDEWGSEFKSVMRLLRTLTVRHGCAIVVFVHLTKPIRSPGRTRQHGSSLADVMGQWTRTVDAVALLADLGEGRARWSMKKKVPKSELTIRQAEGLWTVVQVEATAGPTTEDRVLQSIHADGRNPKGIARSLGLSSSRVSQAIRKLRTHGLLERGHPYRLTPEGLEAVQ